MSLSEFKAWLEGYEASFKGPPSPEQWKAVKAKLETVTTFPVAVPSGIPSSPSIAPAWWQPTVTTCSQADQSWAQAS